MMATIKTDLDSAIQLLSKGLNGVIEKKIKEELTKNAEAVINEVASNIAKNLRANITNYVDMNNGNYVIVLRLDGVQKAIDENK